MRYGASSYIHRHIFRLRYGELFTTRDLLQYGERAAVDMALSRFCRQGFITRLARGVFIKTYAGLRSDSVDPVEVAIAKARAFGKWPDVQFDFQPTTTALQVGADGVKELVLPIFGRTSCFMYGDVRIVLKGNGKCPHCSPGSLQNGHEEPPKVERELPFPVDRYTPRALK